jgi:alkylation response protein AidB-like acyl-CoA dehydrogenase
VPHPVDEAAIRAEVAALLRATPAEALACAHADLGYGFGSWSPQFLRRLGEAELIGLAWPVYAGGRGLPPRASYVLLQELASARAPAEALLYTLAVGQCIYTVGNPQLQEEFLEPMRTGVVTFAEALSEPGAGSDLLALRTSARPDGEDWIVSGQKIWTSNGAVADYALVAVRTDTAAPRHKGISAFIIDLNAPGVQRNAILDATGEPSFAQIFFDDVRVPGHHLVGALHGGIIAVLEALEWDRLFGRCVKAPFLRRELADVVAHVVAAGRWDDQHVRDELARLATEIEVCDALFERALSSMENSGRSAAAEVSMAKLFADELGQRFYETVAGLLGPEAALAPGAAPLDGRVARGALSAHGLLLAGGAPDIQRVTVATRGLGLARA